MITALTRAARRARSSDDRGSMPMLLLVMIVGLLIGGLLVPVVISTNRTTRFETSRVHALDAAQAGIDIVTAKIRAALSAPGIGDATKLPCGTVTGAVNSIGAAQYTVAVDYYVDDPVSVAAAVPMICATGYGVYDVASGSPTPRFALITSTGTDGTPGAGITAGRTIQTTYAFKTSGNMAGGLIRIYPSSTATQAYCLAASSASPSSASTLSLQVCSTATPPASAQVFSYRSDLTIELLSSEAGPNATAGQFESGLCLTQSSTTPGGNMVLQACPAFVRPLQVGADGQYVRQSPNYLQLWSSDDNAHLQDSLPARTNTGGMCMAAASQSSGQIITVDTCAGGTTDPVQTWVPSPSVGAGQAGATNGQLDNYEQFGRCLDVTNFNTSYSINGIPGGGQFLILYSCKQNPNPATIGSNQRWSSSPALTSAPTTGTWTTALDPTFCMTSPLVSGGYVTVQRCATTAATQTTWTTYQSKSASGGELPYSSLYTIRDSNGMCLDSGSNSDLYLGAYYKSVVAPCDGSTSQKWNALLAAPQFQNTLECLRPISMTVTDSRRPARSCDGQF